MDIYRKEDGKIIFGKSITTFICNGGKYFLTSIGVYQDGIVDCWGKVSFDEFQEKVAGGWVKTSIEEGKDIFLSTLGRIENGIFHQAVKEEELIKEVKDVIERLNGRSTTGDICRESFSIYNKDPSEKNKSELKIAYENIPEHERKYVLGDIDVDDIPIKITLYGEASVSDNLKFKLSREKISAFLSQK